MKVACLILCLAFASSTALPTRASRSVLDFLKDVEDIIDYDGKALIEKMINVVHHVENGVLQVKEVVPKVYEKIHEESDEILEELKKVADEIETLLGRRNVFFGFDLLGGLTELPGGTKLSTVLHLLSLADKAHRVLEDAKKFVPSLESVLSRIQGKVEKHVNDFATHVVKEVGLVGSAPAQGTVLSKIGDLFFQVEEEAHFLMLDLLHKMEQTFDVLKKELPEEYEHVKGEVEQLRSQIENLVVEVEKTLVMRSFSLLDLAGNVSGGTSLGTVFKVMSLVDKFNTVVQDVKGFGPRAERVLQHSVQRVADSAQDFFTHAAGKLLE